MNKTSIQTLGILMQARIPVLLLSDPGLGKTDIINAMANEFDLPLTTLILSLRDPTDILGYPYRSEDGKLVYLPPKTIADLAEKGEGVLFLDELTTAEPRVQKAALRMLQGGYAGELKLPEGIAIVAAANPPESATDGYELTPPLANRLAFLNWGFDWDQWASYMRTGDPNTLPKLLHLPSNWESSIPAWRAKILGFLSGQRVLTHKLPTEETERGNAWPSSRTWDKLARGLAAVDSAGGNDEHFGQVATGLVGDAAGLAFLSWLKASKLPDTEKLLKNPNILNISKDDSVTYAIVISVVAAIIQKPTPLRWDNAWIILKKVIESGRKDIAAIGAVGLYELGIKKGLQFPDSIVDMLDVLNKARGL